MGAPLRPVADTLDKRIRGSRRTVSSASLLWILCLAVLAGCSSGKDAADRDFKVLFEVNGVERTVYDFESSYVEHLIATGRNDSRAERTAHLNKMIDGILLSQAAADKGLTDHPIYQAAVRHEERKSMIDNYFVDQMEREIQPLTDDEIRLAYAKRLRKVYIRQLFSRDPAEVDSAYAELESGESFVDVANRFYQTASYDSMAGYLGPISYFGIDDAVAEAAFSTPQGQHTAPVRSRLGHHILYVEHIEFPALLAEDEYQYRKQGVESQLRLRRQRLVSSDYVFDMMSGLDVETHRENLLRLRDAIENLDGEGIMLERPSPESMDGAWTDERVKSLANLFDRSLELATYTLDGKPQVFTFGDYVDWLPYLSFQESKLRLGASVGRGMRNKVLHQLAAAEGYARDERVRKDVRKRGLDVLSELHQFELTKAALQDTQRVEVPESFRSRMISSREQLVNASFWKIPAENLEAAREIKERVANGADPARFDGSIFRSHAPMGTEEPDYALVLKSMLQTPVVAYSADEGWLVLRVDEREVEEVATTTRVQDLERSFKVYDAIRTEVDSLRAIADIQVDTELFDEISTLWSPGD